MIELSSKRLVLISVAGLLAGLVLNFFFKAIEHLSGEKVYTLLLNVDYIPLLKEYSFPEWIEVSFHLLVSIVLSICLYLFLKRFQITSKKKQIIWSVLLCAVIGLVLYPTTSFSVRTPPLTSIPALLYWVGGHVLFGYVLGLMLANLTPSTKR